MKFSKPLLGIVSFLIVLFTMPLGHAAMILMEKLFGEKYIFQAALILGIIGVTLLIFGLKTSNETKATFFGLFSGLFIWTGWIEFSYVYYAKILNISPLLENDIVVTKPEYLIMPSSIGFLAILFLYFLFNNRTQCNFFIWFQKRLKITKPLFDNKGKNRQYALLTAMEMIAVLWTFYIVLLLVYDKAFFGDRHPATYIIAFGTLLWSLYLFLKLIKIGNLAYAIRYSIPTVIIFWNFVEILGRWNVLTEIWVKPLEYWHEILLMFIIFAILIFISFFEKRKETRAIHSRNSTV